MQHPDFEQLKQSLSQVDMVMLSGISLAILLENDRAEMLTLIKGLKQNRVEIVFDSNYRPALWASEDNQKA